MYKIIVAKDHLPALNKMLKSNHVEAASQFPRHNGVL